MNNYFLSKMNKLSLKLINDCFKSINSFNKNYILYKIIIESNFVNNFTFCFQFMPLSLKKT